MKYEHYIFDLYGTLADICTDEDAPELWTALAACYRRHGAAYRPEELSAAYRRLTAQAEAELQEARGGCPEIRIERIFQQLFQEKGAAADLPLAVQTGRRFRELSTAYLRLYDGAAELLEGLRARGGRLWLLSNAQRIFTAPELDRLGLTAYFDGIYLSSDQGVKKPDRRFFDALLREQDIPPERAVMIGNDVLCDILGAQEAGLDALYIRSNLSDARPVPDGVPEETDLRRALARLTAEEAAC